MDEGLETFRPLNTRGAFLIDRGGVLRLAASWRIPSASFSPSRSVLEAARELA